MNQILGGFQEVKISNHQQNMSRERKGLQYKREIVFRRALRGWILFRWLDSLRSVRCGTKKGRICWARTPRKWQQSTSAARDSLAHTIGRTYNMYIENRGGEYNVNESARDYYEFKRRAAPFFVARRPLFSFFFFYLFSLNITIII